MKTKEMKLHWEKGKFWKWRILNNKKVRFLPNNFLINKNHKGQIWC